jgi:hypothetical protein
VQAQQVEERVKLLAAPLAQNLLGVVHLGGGEKGGWGGAEVS